MSAESVPSGTDQVPYQIKAGLLYTEQGIWLARDLATGIVRLGLSDARQRADGPVTFVRPAGTGHVSGHGRRVR